MNEQAGKPGWLRLLVAGGLAALVPKCLACLAGYFALLTGLAVRSPELCGAEATDAFSPAWSLGVATAVILVGAAWLAKLCSRLKR